jgi:hypothetical protein
MSLAEVKKKLDSSKQPHVIQQYQVPAASEWSSGELSLHDRAIYSMWMHFTEYCNKSQAGKSFRFYIFKHNINVIISSSRSAVDNINNQLQV